MEGILRHLDLDLRLLQPRDVGFSFDAEENGNSFGENALIKARAVHALIHGEILPGVTCSPDVADIPALVQSAVGDSVPVVLADDSGICVHALGNRPGIRSARFGEESTQPPTNDEERNDYLLAQLDGYSDRRAHYVCNAVMMFDHTRWLQSQETWHGSILLERHPGNTGFGYDPLVWLEDYHCSVSQLSQQQKDMISHRAKAVRALVRAAGW